MDRKKVEFSLLVCSRNDVDKLLELIEDMKGVVDETVVLDASGPEQAKRLKEMDGELRKKNVKVITVLATSYPDPVKQYGFNNCSGEWVTFLDTDERFNPALKRDIKKIIKNTDCNGFFCGRYEYEHSLDKVDFISLNLRIYRRSKIHSRGDIQDYPIPEGKIGKLDPKYYMMHLHVKSEEMSAGTMGRYMVLEGYRRQSYRMVLDRLKGRPAMYKMAAAYFSLKGKRDNDEELSRFDYRLALTANSLSWIGVVVKNQGVYNYIRVLVTNWKYEGDKIKYLFSVTPKERDRQFNLSAAIYWGGGMTKYLGLDSKKKVEMWNRKYGHLKNTRSVLGDMLDYEYAIRLKR